MSWMDGHRRLHAWQLARALVGQVYRLTRSLPAEERFVLVPQLRRAAWSVPNNIAEGNAKLGRGERRRLFDCALGSLAEIDSMVTTLPDVHRVDVATYQRIDELRRELTAAVFGILRSHGR